MKNYILYSHPSGSGTGKDPFRLICFGILYFERIWYEPSRRFVGYNHRTTTPGLGYHQNVHKGESIPIIKTEHFEKLPTETLAYLFEVIFPSGKKFLDDRVEEMTSTMMT